MIRNLYLLGSVIVISGLRVSSADMIAPDAPKITMVSPSHHTLVWKDTNEDETSYRIHRKKADGKWMWIGSVPADTETFECGGLDGSSFYSYRVQAMLGAVEGPNSATVSEFTLPWPDQQRGRVIESSTIRSDIGADRTHR